MREFNLSTEQRVYNSANAKKNFLIRVGNTQSKENNLVVNMNLLYRGTNPSLCPHLRTKINKIVKEAEAYTTYNSISLYNNTKDNTVSIYANVHFSTLKFAEEMSTHVGSNRILDLETEEYYIIDPSKH